MNKSVIVIKYWATFHEMRHELQDVFFFLLHVSKFIYFNIFHRLLYVSWSISHHFANKLRGTIFSSTSTGKRRRDHLHSNDKRSYPSFRCTTDRSVSIRRDLDLHYEYENFINNLLIDKRTQSIIMHQFFNALVSIYLLYVHIYADHLLCIQDVLYL